VTAAVEEGVGVGLEPDPHVGTGVEVGLKPDPDAVILRLRGVGKRFGGVQAVRDVDLDVAYGERRAILGPNGAGKTTLFNLVAGDFPPSAGTVEVMGRDVTNLPARIRPKLGLARTYQKTRLFPGLTVEDNIFLAIVGRDGGRLRIIPHKENRVVRERARAAAARFFSATRSTPLFAISPTESSGSSRSAWRAPSSRS